MAPLLSLSRVIFNRSLLSMTGARGRGRIRSRSRQLKHTNVRQMMVSSSIPAPSSSPDPATASAHASAMVRNGKSNTTAQQFTQLRTLSQPGTRARKSEVEVPYISLPHTAVHLPAFTEGLETGATTVNYDDDCEMPFDGPSEVGDDLLNAGDDREGDVSESDEESNPEMRRQKEMLADVRVPYSFSSIF
jgi:hypothetical protein